jgi:hypothetical protein
MPITFDGPTLNIALPVGTELDVTDLYSRWKDWVKLGSANAGHPPAFASTGGDEIVAGISEIPHYAFLLNEWEISPDESDHTLNVTTGILLRLGGGDPFIDTAGAFTVRVNYQQPVQALTVGLGDVETGTITLSNQEAMRLVLSALVGKLSGAPAGPINIRDINDGKNRISATVDGSGNRTAIVIDVS